MKRLEDKVAVITGAAQGIGQGIAKVFAEEGALVVVSDRQRDKGIATVNEIRNGGGEAIFIQADVTREDEIRQLVEESVGQYGRLNIFVNNAGICPVISAEESTAEEWDEVMAINVRSIFFSAKYSVRHMRREGGGAILNVASVSSFIAQQGTPAYCASKGAVLMLTRSLALDYGPERIRINSLCPGITDTPLLRFHISHEGEFEKRLEERLSRVPLGTIMYPEDMGHAAAFLCSNEARGITGTSLIIDGGYIACAEFLHQTPAMMNAGNGIPITRH